MVIGVWVESLREEDLWGVKSVAICKDTLMVSKGTQTGGLDMLVTSGSNVALCFCLIMCCHVLFLFPFFVNDCERVRK